MSKLLSCGEIMCFPRLCSPQAALICAALAVASGSFQIRCTAQDKKGGDSGAAAPGAEPAIPDAFHRLRNEYFERQRSMGTTEARRTQIKREHLQELLLLFERGLATATLSSTDYIALIECGNVLGRDGEVMAICRKALAAFPEEQFFRVMLIRLLLRRGDLAQANDMFARFRLEYPIHHTFHALHARYLFTATLG